MAVPVTGRAKRLDMPTHVSVDGCGMRRRVNTIACENICTIAKEDIQKTAGRLPAAVMRAVDRAVAPALWGPEE